MQVVVELKNIKTLIFF